MRAGALLLAAAMLAGTGCGDGTAPLAGTFTATVAGDLPTSLSGIAVFGTTTSGGAEGLLIQLLRGDPQSSDFDLVGLGRYGTERPAVGTYAIVSRYCADCSAGDFDAVYAMHRADGSFAQFRSDSGGTLTIEESTADRLAGTFSFTGIVFVSSTGLDVGTVTVSGSFVAVAGDVSVVG